MHIHIYAQQVNVILICAGLLMYVIQSERLGLPAATTLPPDMLRDRDHVTAATVCIVYRAMLLHHQATITVLKKCPVVDFECICVWLCSWIFVHNCIQNNAEMPLVF